MKIITSHQIEIQGGEQPNVEEIQKQILEGIRTGKININDFANNNQQLSVVTKNVGEAEKKSKKTGTKSENVPEMYKSDYREGKEIDEDDKMTNS